VGAPRWFALRYDTVSKHLLKLRVSVDDRGGLVEAIGGRAE
jgi:hypothetical protein